MGAKSIYFFHHPNGQNPKGIAPDKKVWLPKAITNSTVIDHIVSKGVFDKVYCEKPIYDNLKEKNGIECLESPKVQEDSSPKKIFLYAQSDTLANSLYIVGSQLKSYQVIYVVPEKSSEGADKYFDTKGVKYQTYSQSLLKQEKPDIVIFLNDWSKEPQRIIAHCHKQQVAVICLQESVIDFGDSFKRMQWSDYVFVQGAQTILDLDRSEYYLTGNPRYENVALGTVPDNELVLVNCNFTYGIFEEARENWLDDIHEVSHSLDYPYAISQHPRDKGNLEKYDRVIASSSSKVEEQLHEASCLITRFSSLIHEALVMGKPVIYYNPHGESMQYDFEFDNHLIFLAKTKEELKNALSSIRSLKIEPAYIDQYLSKHCLSREALPSSNIAWLLDHMPFAPGKLSLSDLIKMGLYHPSIKSKLSAVRKTMKGK